MGVGGAEAAGGNTGLFGGAGPAIGAPNPLAGGGEPAEPGAPNMLVNCPGASTALGKGNPDPAFGRPPPIPPLSGNWEGMVSGAGGGAPADGDAENIRVNSPGPCDAAPGPFAGCGGRGGAAVGGWAPTMDGAAGGAAEELNIIVNSPGPPFADCPGATGAAGAAGGAADGVENILVNSPGAAAGALDIEVPGLSREGTWNSFMKSSSRAPAPAGCLAEPSGTEGVENIWVKSLRAGGTGFTSEPLEPGGAIALNGGSVSPRSIAPGAIGARNGGSVSPRSRAPAATGARNGGSVSPRSRAPGATGARNGGRVSPRSRAPGGIAGTRKGGRVSPRSIAPGETDPWIGAGAADGNMAVNDEAAGAGVAGATVDGGGVGGSGGFD